VTKEEIQDILIPFTWVAQYTGLIHGIGAWFDINLGGYILSTAPHAEKTHWHQVRMMLKEPLAVNAFETIYGWLRLVANPLRSYDIEAELVTGSNPLSDPKAQSLIENRMGVDGFSRRRGRWALHEQTYYFEDPTNNINPEYAGLYQPENAMQ
jgi:histone-arginine methyltransferase CARM1